MTELRGVKIESGAEDYQIYQRDARGCGSITVAGRFVVPAGINPVGVMLRLVREESGELAALHTGWQLAATQAQETWRHTFENVPQGGLYRLETAIRAAGLPDEWPVRGDMVHHLGVGDLWVIAGQSNAAGYGKSPVWIPPELGVHSFSAAGCWKLAAHPLADSTRTKYPANAEGGTPSHSPYLHFAKLLKRQLNVPIGLIPTALGGSAISSWLKSLKGELFENMCAYCQDAGAARVRGVLWYQGESDTGAESAVLYYSRFCELVADWRRRFQEPDLPVLTAQLNRYNLHDPADATHAGWEKVREAQRSVARDLPGVYVISTLDLPLSDDIHNNSSANLTLGERLAASALGGVFGQPVKHRHPDVAAALRSGPSQIELQFEHVDSHLILFAVPDLNRLFAVRDEAGAVAVKALSAIAPNVLRLELARDLLGVTSVTGGPASCPTHLVPTDFAGFRPMLAFTVAVPLAEQGDLEGKPGGTKR